MQRHSTCFRAAVFAQTCSLRTRLFWIALTLVACGSETSIPETPVPVDMNVVMQCPQIACPAAHRCEAGICVMDPCAGRCVMGEQCVEGNCIVDDPCDSANPPSDCVDVPKEEVKACDIDEPNGFCPGRRRCEAGACIIDLAPPRSADPNDSQAVFAQIWRFLDENYAAFSAKSVDWDEVRNRYDVLLAQPHDDLTASWLIAAAVEEIRDGHVAAYDRDLCAVDPGFSNTASNVGACVTALDQGYVVYKVSPDSDFVVGDEMIDFDGRTVTQAMYDLEHQPRCWRAASTEAMHTARLVAGLMFRDRGDQNIHVRRNGQEIKIPIRLKSNAQLLACDDRVQGVVIEDHGAGVHSAVLDNVLYVRLESFGTWQNGAFIDRPVIEQLRSAFTRAQQMDGLVLDLRANGGGYPSVYMAIASWVYDQPTKLFSCRSKIGPGRDALGDEFHQTVLPDSTLQYRGPLAVLTNAQSFSAADFTPAFLSQTKRGRTFGVETGGGFGGGGNEVLNERWTLGFNPLLCSGLDGAVLEGHPPAVDFRIEYTMDDLRTNFDRQIEAARDWVVRGATGL